MTKAGLPGSSAARINSAVSAKTSPGKAMIGTPPQSTERGGAEGHEVRLACIQQSVAQIPGAEHVVQGLF